MDALKLHELIKQGETSSLQLKERVNDAYKVGCELVAFSNAQGGYLVIGVDDKTGRIHGLSFQEIQAINALVANAASENVKPSIAVHSEVVAIDGQFLLLITVDKGHNKPYRDNKGIIWTKNGSDKRKVFSNDELRSMLQSSGNLYADKEAVEGSSIEDISETTLKHFLYGKYMRECNTAGISMPVLLETPIEDLLKAIKSEFSLGQVLRNLHLLTEKGELTLAALLLLGKNILKYNPLFTVKCVSFVGTDIASKEFRDKMTDAELETNLSGQYAAVMAFISRNLRNIQVEVGFNSLGRLEIPYDVFVELLVNAFVLVHRDYYQNAPIRLFIFDDRVEIISPGVLPDDMTEEMIRKGVSKPRNPLLFDYAKYLLPYTGIGSGILRALKEYIAVR